MTSWYYVDSGEAKGPVEDDALLRLAQDGALDPASSVCEVGATEWTALGEIESRLGLVRNAAGTYTAETARSDGPPPPPQPYQPPAAVPAAETTIAQPSAGLLRDAATSAASTAQDAATQATNWGQDAAPQAASWAQDAATSAQDAATQAASWGQDAASQGVSWGQDAASTAQDAASQAASWGQDAASQAASWGQDAAGGAVGAAGTAAGAIGGAVGGGPSFPTGQSPAPQGGNPWGGQMPGYPAAPGAMQYPAGYPNAAPAMRYASWGKRAIAIIVDGLVLSIPLGALTAVFGGFESSSGSDGASFSISGPGPLLGLVVGLLYYSILNGRGQTLGKMAMGIRVADKNTGESIGIGRALGRYLVGLVLSALCFVPYVLNVLWPLWDSNNQALHDKAIGSVVLDKG